VQRVLDASDIAASPPFVDRGRELGQLGKFLAETKTGSPRLVVLSGDAGIGKTRLLEETSRRWRSERTRVFPAACHQDVEVPYLPMATLLRPLLAMAESAGDASASVQTSAVRYMLHPAGSRRAGKSPADDGEKLRLFLAASDLVLWAATRETIVLTLEDVHWADNSTIELLGHVLPLVSQRYLQEPVQLLIVMTHRPMADGAAARLLSRLAREPITRNIEVGPLDDVHTLDLLKGLGIRRPAPSLRSLVTQELAEGNPLLVSEVIRKLAMSGALAETPRGVECSVPASDLSGTDNVGSAVGELLEGLGAGCEAALERAAFLGAEFSLAAFAAVNGEDAAVAQTYLDEAVRGRVIVGAGDRYRFRHPLVRQALYERPTGHRRRATHAHVATCLETLFGEEAPAHATDIAHHLVRAGDLASTAMVQRHALVAAEQAEAVCAWREAAEFLECALAAGDRGWSQSYELRASVLQRAGEARQRNRDIGQAIGHFDDLIAETGSRGDLGRKGAALLWHLRARVSHTADAVGGRVDATALEDFVVEAGDGHTELRAEALGELAEAAFAAGEFSRALELAAEAERLAVEVGDHKVAGLVEHAVGLARLGRLELDDAARHFNLAWQHAKLIPDSHFAALGGNNLPSALWAAGSLTEAAAVAETVCTLSAGIGDWSHHSIASACLAGIAVARGELGEAKAYAHEAIQMLHRSGYVWTAAVVFPALASALTLSGEWEEAGAALEEWGHHGGRGRAPYWMLLDAHAGRSPDSLARRLTAPTRERPSLFELGPVCAAIEAAALSDSPDLGRSQLEWLEIVSSAGVRFVPGWCLFVPRLLGVAARAAGEPEAALLHLEEALLIAERAGARTEVGRVHLELARVLIDRPGDRARAEAHLRTAVEVLDEIGARPLAASARRLAEAAGIGGRAGAASADDASRERVILYSDLVASTELNVRAGDAAFVEWMDAHDATVRRRVSALGGVEFKHTGDGICAWFRSATDCLRCALAIQTDLEELSRQRPETPMRLRVGLAAGEPIVSGADLRGLVVATAARICAAAEGGQVLVADSVRRLTEALGYRFELRGFYPLKGLPGEFPLYEPVP
jgi:class 3 adenylate cyclase/tetratricopeptide (TPR) repeat protein